MSNKDAVDILKANGWHFDSECFCGGALKHVYKHVGKLHLEVNIYTRFFEFDVKEYMQTIRPRQAYEMLLTTISNI